MINIENEVTVSVVIPTYNGEAFLEECLQSIEAQTISHEIIVVDDRSTDRTVAVAEKFGARVIVNDVHKGQVAGKNTGIRNMRGQYFLTVDQDDKLMPGALAGLIKELEDNKAMIVMAKLEDFPQSDADRSFCHKEPFRGILTGAALFKKEVFDEIGLFDESVITGDVIDLTDRCKKHGISIVRSDLITCGRRIHGGNFGRTNQKDEYRDYAKLLRRQFLEKIGGRDKAGE